MKDETYGGLNTSLTWKNFRDRPKMDPKLCAAFKRKFKRAEKKLRNMLRDLNASSWDWVPSDLKFSDKKEGVKKMKKKKGGKKGGKGC